MATIKVTEMPKITKQELDDSDIVLITDISEQGTKRSKALTIGVLKDSLGESTSQAELDELVDRAKNVDIEVNGTVKHFIDLTDEEINSVRIEQLVEVTRSALRILARYSQSPQNNEG